MMWIMMRNSAWARHRIAWRLAGSDPDTWPLHEAMIRAVYGW